MNTRDEQSDKLSLSKNADEEMQQYISEIIDSIIEAMD